MAKHMIGNQGNISSNTNAFAALTPT